MRRGFIYFFSFVLFCALSASASAADIQVVPAGGVFGVKKDFTVDVRVSSPDESMNAAQGKLQFDPAILQVKSISKDGSIFSFWLQEPVFSNTVGTLEFIGGSPNGLSGGSLKILSITFTTKAIGESGVLFTNASITAADGSGTDIVQNSTGGNFSVTSAAGTAPVTTTPIVPAPAGQPTPTATPVGRQPVRATGLPITPVIAVPLYPDQSVWYSQVSDFATLWDLPDDVSDVVVVMNQNPNYIAPPALANISGACCGVNFPALTTDGTYFVHVRFKNNIGWGTTAHYRINLDTQPPLPFTITVDTGMANDNPTPLLSFQTGDALSGVVSYVIQIGDEPPIIHTPDELRGTGGADVSHTKLRVLETGIGYLNIRSQPSTGSMLVGRALPGSSYEYTDQRDGWYRIVSTELSDGAGWVLGTYTELLQSGGTRDPLAPVSGSSLLQYRLAAHAPGTYPIAIKAVDRAGNSVEARTEIDILPIDAPLITTVTNRIILGTDDVLALKGTALPDIDVLVTIEDKSHFLVAESSVRSNANGEWEFSLNRDLRRGTYLVTVQGRDVRGAVSVPTQPIAVSVRDKPLIVLFGLEITLRTLLIIVVALLIGLAGYYWRATIVRLVRNQRESVIIGRDISNAFDQVRTMLGTFSGNFEKLKPSKEQKVEYESFVKKVSKSLDKVEKYVKPDVERLK